MLRAFVAINVDAAIFFRNVFADVYSVFAYM